MSEPDRNAMLKRLREACPGIPAERTEEFIRRLPARYFAQFPPAVQAEHLRRLVELSPDRPWAIIADELGGRRIGLTILAFDHPGVFSFLAGILSASGFDIESGDIFTYSRKAPGQASARAVRDRHRVTLERKGVFPDRRRIIDRFEGTLPADADAGEWLAETERRIASILGILERDGSRAPAAVPNAAGPAAVVTGSGSGTGLEEARRRVNEMVASAIAGQRLEPSRVLLPVTIDVETDLEGGTLMRVLAEDTPFFLYSLSNALSLHAISIERVSIRTVEKRVEDEFEFVDSRGNPVTDPNLLDQIRLSVLFTKQFTYFLGRAPDPYRALTRFEKMAQDILALSGEHRWEEFLANPRILQDLARLLGASDFLWEDFIRLQYEQIFPMLQAHLAGRMLSLPPERMEPRLRERITGAATSEEEVSRLNDFKDHQNYLIDLDHLLIPGADFRFLSSRLTSLAEAVVRCAVDLADRRLSVRYGRPRTVAGLPAAYCILGLGKTGGEALGYASDIELLFVYGDNGDTQGGERSISNAEYFERMFRDAVNMISAKREGIFQIDLRLRPWGTGGPVACSLENFCRYYGPGGDALSYERLALVRMRAFGGDGGLGERVERLRDEMIYASDSIDFDQLRTIREKQLAEQTGGQRPNAKFSPGALVDLEYTVQILQVIHGKGNPALRTPRIHSALEVFAETGMIRLTEAERLAAVYDFLRRLINGLRMLRGNAKDLFLPPPGSDEYLHLARRIGCEGDGELSPDRQLRLEFEANTALVRTFVEEHLGRDAIPGPPVGNAADLVLSDTLPEALRERILAEGGIHERDRAYRNLKALAGDGRRRALFAQLAVLAWDFLRSTPDPDMALNNWERFASSLDDAERFFRELLSQPKRLEILLQLFAGSQFLSDTLVRNPDFLEWVTAPRRIVRPRRRQEMEADLEEQLPIDPASIDPGSADPVSADPGEDRRWMNGIRRFRRREILRIGTRDICLRVPMEEVTSELSDLAQALVQHALRRTLRDTGRSGNPEETGFCILAFGKLGGRELNYSSDIDLLAVYDETGLEEQEASAIMDRTGKALTDYTEEGYVYRVDFRLRPYGSSGRLASSRESLVRYYRESAALWEHQALLKLRPLAGCMELGERLLHEIRELLLHDRDSREVARSIHSMRSLSSRRREGSLAKGLDIKNGPGGIRDIEFLLQGLQLVHARRHPELLTGNTLEGLERLDRAGILPARTCRDLMDDYRHLRRIEHFLQIFDDRQIHTLPERGRDLDALARRMDGGEMSGAEFLSRLQERMLRVRETCRGHLEEA